MTLKGATLKERILVLVLIETHGGETNKLRNYEKAILPILQRHGGEFISIMQPIIGTSGAETHVDEMHLLSFDHIAGFGNFQADPELAQHHPLREEAVKSLRFIQGKPFDLKEYFS